MSKRAIEEAWKAYPKRPEQKYITAHGTFELDYDAPNREGFIKGYETAEKYLTLTPDDIKLITKIHYEIVFKDTTGIKVGDVASEVLKRYLEEKK